MIKVVCIIAGGSGSRLWPASVREKPKHFLSFGDEKSLLIETLERALSLAPEIIHIVTLAEQVDLTKRECISFLEKNGKALERTALEIIPEPKGRNTAPAVAASCSVISSYGLGEVPLMVLPADHIVRPVDLFAEDALKAAKLAGEGYLVTFGISPVRPETGYGYIEAGHSRGKAFLVASFREKPDLKTAEEYLKKGGFYWNSGMFMFTPVNYLRQLKELSPAIFKPFSTLSAAKFPVPESAGIRLWPGSGLLREIYAVSPSNSIDYAVMEKTSRAAVVPASFSWSDVGSWDEIAGLYSENRIKLPTVSPPGDTTPVYEEEAENCYVYSDVPVALCGVSDLIVVQKNGALLICKKGESQRVKKIAEKFGS